MSSEGSQSKDGSQSESVVNTSIPGKAREYAHLESFDDEADLKVRYETKGWYGKVFWQSLVYLF
jgi:hypothetical protein